jgi:hypothetical protein
VVVAWSFEYIPRSAAIAVSSYTFFAIYLLILVVRASFADYHRVSFGPPSFLFLIVL